MIQKGYTVVVKQVCGNSTARAIATLQDSDHEAEQEFTALTDEPGTILQRGECLSCCVRYANVIKQEVGCACIIRA